MDFPFLFIWEWIIWTGIGKRNNFVKEFTFRNVHFESGFQVTPYHWIVNKINESLDWCVQHFLLNCRITIFPACCAINSRHISGEIRSVQISFSSIWAIVHKVSVIMCVRIREKNLCCEISMWKSNLLVIGRCDWFLPWKTPSRQSIRSIWCK